MNLIFIHLGDKKISYLNDSIKQAIFFNKDINIILVSNKKTFNSLDIHIKKKIIFEDVSKIIIKKNHTNFIKNNLLDKHWYKGFWRYTSERFFYLQNIVKKRKLKNIFHIENDLLIYFNIKSKLKIFNKYYNIGLLLDSNIKAIPSFMYFKNSNYLDKFVLYLEKQHSLSIKIFGKTVGKIYEKIFKKNFFLNNDMDILLNFYFKHKKKNKISALPSATPSLKKNKKYSKNIKISKNFDKFGGIFDPANFGLYLDGFDSNRIFSKKLIKSDPYIEKSAVDVRKYKIKFSKFNKMKYPYITENKKKIKLLTLHIHSKRLYKFLSKK